MTDEKHTHVELVQTVADDIADADTRGFDASVPPLGFGLNLGGTPPVPPAPAQGTIVKSKSNITNN